MTEPRFLARPGRPALAYRRREGTGPSLVFLPGYMSDMEGSKATALDSWAAGQGRATVRFDYSGCGSSGGAFEQQTLADWRDDVLAMLDLVGGPVLLVGSSMGGWLMLLAALERPEQVVGLVGIAAAPDFTDWGFDSAQKARIREVGRLEEPSAYGPAPCVTTLRFWESGESLKLLDGGIALDCPVRLLHGLDDPDVPWRISLELSQALRSADVQTLLVKGGDHRLSRESDIASMLRAVHALLEEM